MRIIVFDNIALSSGMTDLKKSVSLFGKVG